MKSKLDLKNLSEIKRQKVHYDIKLKDQTIWL